MTPPCKLYDEYSIEAGRNNALSSDVVAWPTVRRTAPHRGHELAQPIECPDDLDAGGNGNRTVKDRGEHDDAVFSECVRQVLDVLAAPYLQGCKMQP
jgi:hypothetical protein